VIASLAVTRPACGGSRSDPESPPMKNAWFVLGLVASILIHAAIIDSARLEPLPPLTGAPTAAPVIEARGAAQPPRREEFPTRTSAAIRGDAAALAEQDQPELPAIDSGSSYALRR
jgi:hypothetical protein